jgi:hypothetical protein
LLIFFILLLFSYPVQADLRFEKIKIEKQTLLNRSTTKDFDISINNNLNIGLTFADKDSYEFDVNYYKYIFNYPYNVYNPNSNKISIAKAYINKMELLLKKRLDFLSNTQSVSKIFLGGENFFGANEKIELESENNQIFTLGFGHFFNNRIIEAEITLINKFNLRKKLIERKNYSSLLYKMKYFSLGGEMTFGSIYYDDHYVQPGIIFIHRLNKYTMVKLNFTNYISNKQNNKAISSAVIMKF